MKLSWVLGLLTPLLPVFGRPYLLFLALLFLLFHYREIKISRISWGISYLFLSLIWAGCFYYWRTLNPAHLYFIGNGLVLLGLFSVFSSNKSQLENFKTGLLKGLPLALIVGCLEVILNLKEVFPNQNAYWNSLGRIAATFSDPNAFGISAVLCVAIVLGTASRVSTSVLHRWLMFGLVCAIFALVSFSGSRSFYLGLALYLVMFLWRESPSYLLTLFGLGFLCIYFGKIEVLESSQLPVGLQRLFSSLDLSNLNSTLFSRLVFWKIGLHIWLDNLMLGCGLENFRNLVPQYSSRLGINIGTWTDNSNNFYLGTLAEFGLLGGLALGFAFYRLKFKADALPIYKSAILALLSLFLLGPHLNFVEVNILTAYLMAATLEVRDARAMREIDQFFFPGLCILILICVPLRAKFIQMGLYPVEREVGGKEFQWTGQHARSELQCQDGKATFEVRATNPDLSLTPLNVRLTFLGSRQTLVLNNYDLKLIEFDCQVESEGMLELETSRTWRPKDFGSGEDRRDLGIQLFRIARTTV